MGPKQVGEEMVKQMLSVQSKLSSSSFSGSDYAQAYGEMKAIVSIYSRMVIRLDPSSDLNKYAQ